MSLRRTFWTGLSSYGQLASVTVSVLLSMPLALRFLTAEEFGLWSFASQAVGYLLLIDLGLSGSIGRLMADPLHSGRREEVDRWFSLCVTILVAQAALLLALGIPAVGAIVRWFGIPAALRPDAARLLTLLIISNAVAHPFRICTGILFAQNRAYAVNVAQILGAWVNLAAFAAFLLLGFRSLSYGLAAAAMTVAQIGVAVIAVRRGPHRFRWQRVPLWSAETRELVRFSSGLFFVGIGVQIVLISQSLILTKFAGLAAVASFNVSTRAGMLLLQLLWRPFDSFAPRWQQLYVEGGRPRLAQEYLTVLRLTLGLTFVGVIWLAAFNGLFVSVWARADLYLGTRFDFLLGSYLLVQTLNHCLSLPFVLAKDTRTLAIVSLAEAAANLAGTIWAVKRFGPPGLLAASVAATLVVSLCWIARAGPRRIGIAARDIVTACLPLAPIVGLLLVSYTLGFLPAGAWQLRIGILLAMASGALLLFSSRRELEFVLRRMRSPAGS